MMLHGQAKHGRLEKLFLEQGFKRAVIKCSNSHTRKPRTNRNAVIGMCSAILLKFRNSKMSMVQKMLSLILYAGNSGKQVC